MVEGEEEIVGVEEGSCGLYIQYRDLSTIRANTASSHLLNLNSSEYVLKALYTSADSGLDRFV